MYSEATKSVIGDTGALHLCLDLWVTVCFSKIFSYYIYSMQLLVLISLRLYKQDAHAKCLTIEVNLLLLFLVSLKRFMIISQHHYFASVNNEYLHVRALAHVLETAFS